MEANIKDVQEQLGAAKLREEALKSAIEEKEAYIEQLEAQVSDPSATAKAKEPVVPEQHFEVNAKSFKFTLPSFWWKGERKLSEEAINDDALLTEMVSCKVVGVFVEVNE